MVMADWRHKIESINTSTFYVLSYFFNLLFLVVLYCRRCSLLQRWRSPRAVRSAMTAHSRCTPWRVPPVLVGFRVSRDFTSMSCISRFFRGSFWWRVLRIALTTGAHSDVFMCEQCRWHIEHTYLYTCLK
jgi:hypothetical protein